MKITPRLLKRKGSDTGRLQMVVYYNGVQKEFSLGRSILLTDWDVKHKKAIGVNREAINAIIRKYQREIESKIDICSINGQLVDLNAIVSSLFDKTQDKKLDGPIKLVDFIDDFVSDNPQNLKSISLKSYSALKSHVLTISPNIKLIEVDQMFIKKLVDYLESIGNKVNSIATKLKKLRKILGLAFRRGLITDIPFGKDKYQIKVQKNIKRKFLNTEEETKLLSYVGASKTEQIVMDLVRFNLNVGLRIRDLLLLLRKNDFQIKYIDGNKLEIRLNTRTDKTDTEVNILIASKSTAILLKHDILSKNTDNFVFEWVKHDKLTDEESIYKEISSKTALFNKILKSICLKVGIPIISSHCIRHTLATKLLSNSVPITSISRVLGHSSVTTTQIYAIVVQNTLDSHIISGLEG